MWMSKAKALIINNYESRSKSGFNVPCFLCFHMAVRSCALLQWPQIQLVTIVITTTTTRPKQKILDHGHWPEHIQSLLRDLRIANPSIQNSSAYRNKLNSFHFAIAAKPLLFIFHFPLRGFSFDKKRLLTTWLLTCLIFFFLRNNVSR